MADDTPNLDSVYKEEVLSPCNKACPAGINIPGYIALLLENREEDAYRLIRNNNPFPAVLGRVCPHPCETNCRRLEYDKAVSICILKAFAADNVRNFPTPISEEISAQKQKSVGIIGGGPSGLSCAYYLAKLGYDVTVYEAQPVAGGMMAIGIPQYRLPMDVVLWEIDAIQRLGVKLLTNTEVGKDISYLDLEKKHNAIYIAIGMSKGSYINIENEKAPDVVQAVDFLRDVKLALHLKKPLPKVGKRVVVIGGGNVSVDTVRTAKRLGAEKVFMFCLEQRNEMPAWAHEVEEALTEGICLENGWGPKKIILDKKGKVKGISFKECTQVFSKEGKFAPQYCEDETNDLECDTIIMAVGQSPDSTFLQNIEGIQLFRGKWVIGDPTTFKTSRKGVFVGGDILKPGLMIDAISHGRTAAKSIDLYLGGTGKLMLDTTLKLPSPQFSWRNWPVHRTEIQFIDKIRRENTFDETNLMLTPLEAKWECDRCLCCEPSIIDPEKCMGCGTCVKNCPWEAITFQVSNIQDFFGERKIRKAIVDPVKCHTCSVCLSDCPVNAISFAKWSDEAYIKEISSRPKILILSCYWMNYTGIDIQDNIMKSLDTDIRIIRVMCAARINRPLLFKSFENGIDGILIFACQHDKCRHEGGNILAQQRIESTNALFKNIGYLENRIQFQEIDLTKLKTISEYIKLFSKQIHQLGHINK